MKKIIGTAQFGMPYGVAKHSMPNKKQIYEILDYALEKGVNWIDTAPAYGESEKILGDYPSFGKKFRVMTKLSKIYFSDVGESFLEKIKVGVEQSLTKLKIDCIDVLYLHSVKNLKETGANDFWNMILDFRRQGIIRKIGLSCYSVNEAKELFSSYKFDTVQFPYNLFDQRYNTDENNFFITKNNIEVHLRSIFLQGLLLMNPSNRPNYFGQFSEQLKNYDEFLLKNNLSALEACLLIVKKIKADGFLIGINSLEQLKEINETWDKIKKLDTVFNPGLVDEKLINPSLWKT